MGYKQRLLAVSACLLIVVLAIAMYLRIAASDSQMSDDVTVANIGTYQTTQLKLGDKLVTMDIADTPDKMRLGLGGRQSLAADRGMVFVYAGTGQRCFWMKDMKFSIDILWLDAQRKVGHIEKSLSPDTYPQTYCPDVATQYVVELPAGASEADGIKVGDSLGFEL